MTWLMGYLLVLIAEVWVIAIQLSDIKKRAEEDPGGQREGG